MTDGRGGRTERLLGIDAGTSGLRAVVFAADGEPLAAAEVEYRPQLLAGGRVEQDASTWIAALERAVPRALAAAPDPPGVAAVAITSQRATTIPVDADGGALMAAISWRDKRSLSQCERIAEVVGEERIYAGTGLIIDPYFTLPKLMWIAAELPALYRRTYRFLSVQDLLVHHLSGAFATDTTQASRTMLMDLERFAWDADIAHACGVDLGRLPDPLSSGAVAGAVRRDAGRRLGLQAGAPVVLAGGDQQCAAIGLGVTRPGQAEVTMSSGSFALAPTAAPCRDPRRRLLCSASGVDGGWIVEAGTFTAMSAYRWVRDATGDTAGIERALTGSPPGAGGVVVLPHLAGSAAPHWEPAARGAMLGLRLEHTRDDLLRAMLEGIAIDTGLNVAAIAALLGAVPRFEEIRLSGSGARSDAFNQLQADVYGCHVVPGSEHATALGAAIQAAAATSIFPDVHAAAERMVRLERERERRPDGRLRALYDELASRHERAFRAVAAVS